VESAQRADEVAPACAEHGKLEARLDALGAAVGKKNVPGPQRRSRHGAAQDGRAVCAQWVKQLLRVQRLLGQLRAHGRHHNRVRVPAAVDAEAAQQVNVLPAGCVNDGAAARLAVAPLERRVPVLLGNALTVPQESRVDVQVPAEWTHKVG